MKKLIIMLLVVMTGFLIGCQSRQSCSNSWTMRARGRAELQDTPQDEYYARYIQEFILNENLYYGGDSRGSDEIYAQHNGAGQYDESAW